MIKIALAQMEIIPARPDLNTRQMLQIIQQAKQAGTQIIIFPAMSIPGYLIGNIWGQHAFLRDCEAFGQEIIAAAQDICIVFGNIGIDWDKCDSSGNVKKYNAVFVAQCQTLVKNNASPYPFHIAMDHSPQFNDCQHFTSLSQCAFEQNLPLEKLLQPIQVILNEQNIKLGCLVGHNSLSNSSNYMQIMHKQHNLDMIINIAASPFYLGKNKKLNKQLSEQAKQLGIPYINVDCVGVQNIGKTVYTFAGCSAAYNGHGSIIASCPPFAQSLTFLELHLTNQGNLHQTITPFDDNGIDTVHQTIAYGMERFLKSINMQKVVIGISGGIDSAVAAALYAHILGPENVLLANMPSKHNSQTTKDLAAQTAQNLGCLYTIIPIQQSVNYTVEQITTSTIVDFSNKKEFSLPVTSFMLENMQARDRAGRILAALAAAFGSGFTCNGNKSEISIGYSTFYGDNAGFFAPLADLWKYQIYAVASYLNDEVYGRKVIPEQTLNLPPSAELSDEQAVDQGKGDPIIYPYHDYLFRAFCEYQPKVTPEDILNWYLQEQLEEKIGCQIGLVKHLFSSPHEFINDLERWWSLFTGIAVAKRLQGPPLLAISHRPFGYGYQESQLQTYFTSNYIKTKKFLLKGE